jgi:hypothetical protein
MGAGDHSSGVQVEEGKPETGLAKISDPRSI